MVKLGDIVSYIDMCREEGVNLQRGMNYRLHPRYSVILMSVRVGAPYADRVENNGRILIYEGHDVAKREGGPDPKISDQPMTNPNGTLTQNGLFFEAANKYQNTKRNPELVKVYEKIRPGIWAYNGIFRLAEAWKETSKERRVFKFKLEMVEDIRDKNVLLEELDHSRLIPSAVKLEVWKRDNGQCVKCGSKNNLHFDHIIPYSKGGSSLEVENIQLLCARHNLAKRNRIE